MTFAAERLRYRRPMAAPPLQPNLNREQRRALALLASIPRGVSGDLLVLAHGFDRAMIAGLVHEGLATARRETITAAHRTTIEVVRITNECAVPRVKSVTS